MFFDDVPVPVDRTLGGEGDGWLVGRMDLLPYERSTALWHRGAYLHRRFQTAPRRRRTRRAGRRPPSVRSPSCCTRSGPAPAPRSTAWRREANSGPRPRSTRSSWPPPSRRCSTSSPTALVDDVSFGDDPTSGTLAGGVPLLAGRHDLRRQRRRSNATSSPAACSISGATADGRRRSRAVPAEHFATPPRATPAARSTPPSTSWGGETRSPPIGGSRCQSSSSCRARPTRPPPRSTRCSAPRSVSARGPQSCCRRPVGGTHPAASRKTGSAVPRAGHRDARPPGRGPGRRRGPRGRERSTARRAAIRAAEPRKRQTNRRAKHREWLGIGRAKLIEPSQDVAGGPGEA